MTDPAYICATAIHNLKLLARLEFHLAVAIASSPIGSEERADLISVFRDVRNEISACRTELDRSRRLLIREGLPTGARLHAMVFGLETTEEPFGDDPNTKQASPAEGLQDRRDRLRQQLFSKAGVWAMPNNAVK